MTNDQRSYYGPLISEALIFIFISCAKYNRSYNFTGYNSHIQNLSNHIKTKSILRFPRRTLQCTVTMTSGYTKMISHNSHRINTTWILNTHYSREK